MEHQPGSKYFLVKAKKVFQQANETKRKNLYFENILLKLN